VLPGTASVKKSNENADRRFYDREKQGYCMDSHKVFLVGLVVLAVIVIADGIWVVLTPPVNDEPQAYALVAIGIFMLLIGYSIAQRNTGNAS
jgi:hypothetical protein